MEVARRSKPIPYFSIKQKMFAVRWTHAWITHIDFNL